MNIHRPIAPPPTPQPVRFTAEDYFGMAGALNVRFEKTELLDGAIYEMPIDGPMTRKWNSVLNEWLVRNKGAGVALVNHQTLPLGEYWAPSPDHYLFPSAVGHEKVTGANVLLIIEVSDTTLDYDLGGKANAYAEHGVREYWVIDPKERRVFVHRLNETGEYGEPRIIEADGSVKAMLIPGFKLRLADLPEVN